MDIKKLKVDAKLQGRNSKNILHIQGYQPATANTLQMWQVNGGWFNYAQLEARFRLYKGALSVESVAAAKASKPQGVGRGNGLRKKKNKVETISSGSVE